MLVRENKQFYIIALFLVFSFACSKQKNPNEYVDKNFISYSKEYDLFNDSLKYYSISSLKDYNFLNNNKWILDSMICLSSDKNKLIGTVLVSSGTGDKGASDWATKYLGKKINGKWYFFQGATLIVPRDMYGKDALHPLTFKELSDIARKEILVHYLIEKNGEWVVNDAKIDSYFNSGGFCGHCKTVTQFDSAHWSYITDKWKHKIDTNEFKRN